MATIFAAGGGPTPKGVSIPLAYLTPRQSPEFDAHYHDRPSGDGDPLPQELPAEGYTPAHTVSGEPHKGVYTAIPTAVDDLDHKKEPPSFQVPHAGTWRPFWLRRLVFGAFFSIFASLAALVALLYVFSQRSHGLFNADPSWTYTWRFGPIAGAFDSPSPLFPEGKPADQLFL